MLLIISKILLLSWFISSFRPIHDLINWIKSMITNPFLYLVVDFTHEMFSCIKCCSFWLGLVSGNFWLGLVSSFTSYIYIMKIQPWIEKYK